MKEILTLQRIQTQKSLWLRVILILTGALYAFSACREAGAQNSPPPRLITLHFKQTPFRAALRELFRQADVPYRLDTQLETFLSADASYAETKVTLDYNELPFPQALDRLMRFNDGDNISKPIGLMHYRQQKDVYVFSHGEGISEEKVTINDSDTDLANALKQICAQVGVSYVLDLREYATRHITLPMLNMPFAQAVSRLLEAAHASSALELTVMSGVAIVGCFHPLDLSYHPPTIHPSQNTVVCSLQNENLYTALRAICLSTGESFLLSRMADLSRAKNIAQTDSVEHVLKSLIRASTFPLKYRYSEKMVQIVEKHPSKEHQW